MKKYKLLLSSALAAVSVTVPVVAVVSCGSKSTSASSEIKVKYNANDGTIEVYATGSTYSLGENSRGLDLRKMNDSTIDKVANAIYNSQDFKYLSQSQDLSLYVQLSDTDESISNQPLRTVEKAIPTSNFTRYFMTLRTVADVKDVNGDLDSLDNITTVANLVAKDANPETMTPDQIEAFLDSIRKTPDKKFYELTAAPQEVTSSTGTKMTVYKSKISDTYTATEMINYYDSQIAQVKANKKSIVFDREKESTLLPQGASLEMITSILKSTKMLPLSQAGNPLIADSIVSTSTQDSKFFFNNNLYHFETNTLPIASSENTQRGTNAPIRLTSAEALNIADKISNEVATFFTDAGSKEYFATNKKLDIALSLFDQAGYAQQLAINKKRDGYNADFPIEYPGLRDSFTYSASSAEVANNVIGSIDFDKELSDVDYARTVITKTMSDYSLITYWTNIRTILVTKIKQQVYNMIRDVQFYPKNQEFEITKNAIQGNWKSTLNIKGIGVEGVQNQKLTTNLRDKVAEYIANQMYGDHSTTGFVDRIAQSDLKFTPSVKLIDAITSDTSMSEKMIEDAYKAVTSIKLESLKKDYPELLAKILKDEYSVANPLPGTDSVVRNSSETIAEARDSSLITTGNPWFLSSFAYGASTLFGFDSYDELIKGNSDRVAQSLTPAIDARGNKLTNADGTPKMVSAIKSFPGLAKTTQTDRAKILAYFKPFFDYLRAEKFTFDAPEITVPKGTTKEQFIALLKAQDFTSEYNDTTKQITL